MRLNYSTFEKLDQGFCLTRDMEMWHSPDGAKRAKALRLCLACPALDACKEATALGPTPTEGVVAGVDWGHKKYMNRMSKDGIHLPVCWLCDAVREALGQGVATAEIPATVGKHHDIILRHFKIFQLTEMREAYTKGPRK
jgi:Transcription factor WhiB